jgi:hypothetical protein
MEKELKNTLAFDLEEFNTYIKDVGVSKNLRKAIHRILNYKMPEFLLRYRTNIIEPRVQNVSLFDEIMARLSDLSSLTKNLIGDTNDHLRKIKLIHDWIAAKVSYDSRKIGISNNYQATLKSFSGVCKDYAELFLKMCEIVSIPCKTIKGFTKQASHANHMWNAVRIGPKWYIVDVTWDSEPYRTKFLLLPPEVAIFTHFPEDEQNQFLEYPLTRKAFDIIGDYIDGNLYSRYKEFYHNRRKKLVKSWFSRLDKAHQIVIIIFAFFMFFILVSICRSCIERNSRKDNYDRRRYEKFMNEKKLKENQRLRELERQKEREENVKTNRKIKELRKMLLGDWQHKPYKGGLYSEEIFQFFDNGNYKRVETTYSHGRLWGKAGGNGTFIIKYQKPPRFVGKRSGFVIWFSPSYTFDEIHSRKSTKKYGATIKIITNSNLKLSSNYGRVYTKFDLRGSEKIQFDKKFWNRQEKWNDFRSRPVLPYEEYQKRYSKIEKNKSYTSVDKQEKLQSFSEKRYLYCVKVKVDDIRKYKEEYHVIFRNNYYRGHNIFQVIGMSIEKSERIKFIKGSRWAITIHPDQYTMPRHPSFKRGSNISIKKLKK